MSFSGAPRVSPERIYISQGQFAVERGHGKTIVTLLGSCVSACIWDAETEVGGMNHVLFTDNHSHSTRMMGHGINSMELLINGLLKAGAVRNNLKAKAFGGANMISGLTDAGERNGTFVIDYLEREGITYVGGSLGGLKARQLEFEPGTGRARAKLVNSAVIQENPLQVSEMGIELF